MIFDIKSDSVEEFESRKTAREKKLAKRLYPRGRRIINKALLDASVQKRNADKIRKAKAEIKKVSDSFENLKEADREKQKEIYIRWIKDSLRQNSPILDPGDLHLETALASVGAGGQNLQKNRTSVRLTHIPTRLSVRNEEERSLFQNRENAQKHLFSKLNEHLNYWKILSLMMPTIFSLSEINRVGVNILDNFNQSEEVRI